MLLAGTTWAGTLPTWIILFVGLFAAYRLSRGGGGSAVSELSKANEVLTKRLHELGGEVRDLRVENERLKARTDFAQALAPLMEKIVESINASEVRQGAIMEAQAAHEDRAAARQDGTLRVLGLIAGKLGGEHNGH